MFCLCVGLSVCTLRGAVLHARTLIVFVVVRYLLASFHRRQARNKETVYLPFDEAMETD